MANKRRIGGYYEEQAAKFLRDNGLVILEQNFRCRLGEVDLIARDGKYLVFVEVKYRFNDQTGSAAEAVHRQKQKRISRVAWYYLTFHHGSIDVPCRFDVVGIDREETAWIKNAFDYLEG